MEVSCQSWGEYICEEWMWGMPECRRMKMGMWNGCGCMGEVCRVNVCVESECGWMSKVCGVRIIVGVSGGGCKESWRWLRIEGKGACGE